MSKGLRTGLVVTGIVLAILIIGSLVGRFVGWSCNGWGMTGPWMMGSYGGTWVMPMAMIIFGGLVIWGIATFLSFDASTSRKHDEPALAVLKSRYAHGEISKQEYEEKRRDLV